MLVYSGSGSEGFKLVQRALDSGRSLSDGWDFFLPAKLYDAKDRYMTNAAFGFVCPFVKLYLVNLRLNDKV